MIQVILQILQYNLICIWLPSQSFVKLTYEHDAVLENLFAYSEIY